MSKRFASRAAACAAALLFVFSFSICRAAEKAPSLKVATFIMASDIERLLRTGEGRKQAVDILKGIGVKKIYLDTYRDGLITDTALLSSARDYFKASGFEVSAGITTTKGKNFGIGSTTHRYWLCYNYPETRNAIRGVMENAAKIFDEIIVDDFLATDCRCPECDGLRAGRDWGQFFRDNLVEVSRDDIVGAAKKVNPNINIIIKYPQWYDRFHAMGYDVARQPGIYDMVWVGTETRDPKKENVQQYEAFVNYSWLKSAGGDKTHGGWFDWINCYPDVYMEQAYQTVLAGAEEMVLFGYSPEMFLTDNLREFTARRPQLEKMYLALREFRHDGIFAYKPPNGDPGADTYIFDYMGMLGLPLVMSAQFPADARAAFLSEHALADAGIAAKTIEFLKKGGTVIATTSFLAGIKGNADIMKAAGFEGGEVKKSSKRMAIDFVLADGAKVKAPGYVMLGATLTPGAGAKVLASVELGGKSIPFITEAKAGEGRFVVLNTRTYESEPNGSDLTVSGSVLVPNIPDAVSAILRAEAVSALGVTMEGPSRVGTYFYRNGNDTIVAFDNFNDADATMKIALPAAGALEDVLSGEKISAAGGAFAVPVPKRSVRLLRVK